MAASECFAVIFEGLEEATRGFEGEVLLALRSSVIRWRSSSVVMFVMEVFRLSMVVMMILSFGPR